MSSHHTAEGYIRADKRLGSDPRSVTDRRAHPAPVSNTPALLLLTFTPSSFTHQWSATAAEVSDRRLESGKCFKMTMTLAYWDIRGVSLAVVSAVANRTSFVGGAGGCRLPVELHHRPGATQTRLPSFKLFVSTAKYVELNFGFI